MYLALTNLIWYLFSWKLVVVVINGFSIYICTFIGMKVEIAAEFY
jgi:hypothetical protein